MIIRLNLKTTFYTIYTCSQHSKTSLSMTQVPELHLKSIMDRYSKFSLLLVAVVSGASSTEHCSPKPLHLDSSDGKKPATE